MLFCVKTVLLVLGILRALVTLQNILRFLYEHMLPSTVSLKQKYPAKAKGKRPWALITGSSDGIGAEYARYLAQGGFNLILVSRDADKLKAVTEDIKYAYPSAETKVIQVDFTRESALHPSFFHDLRKQVNDLDISIVIACAGCFSMGRFEKTPGKYLEAMLDVNIYHNIMMSKVFMPMLIEQRSSKGFSSAFVSFSSISANHEMPFFGTTYMCTKAVTDYLGQAFIQELGTHNLQVPVDFQVVYPGGVNTCIFKRQESSNWPRMSKLQGFYMNDRSKCVAHYVKSLEMGFSETIGTVYDELVNGLLFVIPLCLTAHTQWKYPADYACATFGEKAKTGGNLGLNDPAWKHIIKAFEPMFI